MDFADGVHLDGLQTAVLALLCLPRDISRTVAANPSIDLHFIADFAAQQFIDRRIMVFSLDVPQGLIDAGNRAHHHRSAAVKAAAVQRLPNIFNVTRIAPQQII